jgi:hypothetical protein
MTENTNENTNENTTENTDSADVEGHRLRHAPVDERTRPGLIEDDDVEGHAVRQAPADEVSDEGTEFDRPR